MLHNQGYKMKIKFNKMKILVVTVFLIAIGLAFIAHYYNMFNYPYFENDEGTYYSQAYTVAYQGKLANYTYWYDHAPFGWIQVAGWMLLTGGPFAFGYSLNSARILMLIFHCLDGILIFLLVNKLTRNYLIAFLSVLLFSLSPLGIYFQRRLLLDNIMTFWILSSFSLLIFAKQRLVWILGSGIAIAIAVLTKETAIVSLPALMILAYFALHNKQKFIGIAVFVSPIILMVLYYLLYAIIKRELFPGSDHVSLIETILFQIKRGESIPFWQPGSTFVANFIDWFKKDKIFLLFSIISNIWIVVNYKIVKEIRILGFMGILFWLFLLTKSLILNFYIIPLIPIGSIAIAIFIKDILKIKFIGLAFVIIIFFLWIKNIDIKTWTVDENSPQIKSVEWIKKNISPKSILAVDHSQLLNLQFSRYDGDPNFSKAHWFLKISKDPEIKRNIVNNDWQNIDYLILSHEYLKQVELYPNDFLTPTIDHAVEIASWGPVSSSTYLNINQKISTNGDWIKVYKMLDRNEIILKDSWEYYKNNFISFEGQVVDPQTNITTSEGQSYALLRSVIVNDKASFNSIWNWTKSHLQSRNEDKLFSWKWGKIDGKEKILDFESASDADIDIATALILASKKWKNLEYEKDAKEIVNDIWKKEVVKLNDNKYYLIAGSWAGYGGIVYINPSYISPASFRIFKNYTPEQNWDKLIIDSYGLLKTISKSSNTGLVSDWVAIDKESLGFIEPEIKTLSNNFGYDAVRVYYRISQDYIWNNSKEALEILKNQQFLIENWNKNKKVNSVYSLEGESLVDYDDNSIYGILLPYFSVLDKKSYQELKTKLQKDFQNGGWKTKNNYCTQNWIWLGLALAEGKYKYE